MLDDRTIAYPSYDGNGMFLSAGNIGVNPEVGLLFIDLERGTRLRFNGTASIDVNDPLIDSYPGCQFVVRVRGAAVFANCRRYVHRYELVERSSRLGRPLLAPFLCRPSPPSFVPSASVPATRPCRIGGYGAVDPWPPFGIRHQRVGSRTGPASLAARGTAARSRGRPRPRTGASLTVP